LRKLTEFVARLPHWAVFIVLLFTMLIEDIDLGVVYLIWVFSLAHVCSKNVSREVYINKKIIGISSYLILGLLVLYFAAPNINNNSSTGILVLFVPFFLFLMFSMMYPFYIAAKVIRSAELRRTAKFEETFFILFSLLAWAIGVWFIQNRVKKIIQEGAND
jgi:hypothetical protein